MPELQLLTNRLFDLERTLSQAHGAYATVTARTVRPDMINRTVALMGSLSNAINEGTFLRMDMSSREENAAKALVAINQWLSAAYGAPEGAPVILLRGKRARRKKIPKAVALRFASPSTIGCSLGRPSWRSEEAHEEIIREVAYENLFRDVRQMFGHDIDQQRSVRRLRVINALTRGSSESSDAHGLWNEFESAFDAVLGRGARYGSHTDAVPFGKRLADHVEQMLFECASAALEGDELLFEASVALAETTSCMAILGPVASVDETGVWAAFHLT